jgi:hypothetical protein
MLDSLNQRAKNQKQYDLMAVCELKSAKLVLETVGDESIVSAHIDKALEIIGRNKLSELEASADLTRASAFELLGFGILFRKHSKIFKNYQHFVFENRKDWYEPNKCISSNVLSCFIREQKWKSGFCIPSSCQCKGTFSNRTFSCMF